MGSIVCYDRSVKENLLQISPDIIDEFTAESAEVTMHMALSLQKLIPADVIIAVTGLASGGGSENPEKPVGTMFVHGIVKGNQWKSRLEFDGSPDDIVKQTIDAIATILLDKLNDL